jgi:hypothetical protein
MRNKILLQEWQYTRQTYILGHNMMTANYLGTVFNFGDIPKNKKALLLIEQNIEDKKMILYDSFNVTDTIYNIKNLKLVTIHRLDSLILNI